MALFALGYEGEAANRLDTLAEGGDGGSEDHRIKYRAEAANFWLAAGDASRAYSAATAGLDMAPKHAELRIARARAYALSGRPDYAETDLSTVLAYHPRHAEALRYRADARLRQDRLDGAKDDVERSLQIDITSVETALLRGRINEAIRLKALDEAKKTPDDAGAEILSQETLDAVK
jgi:tetratricopeptide (TPR) repeat protein